MLSLIKYQKNQSLFEYPLLTELSKPKFIRKLQTMYSLFDVHKIHR